ncbi:ABC transporter ATP-binding protein [soil metagenome]
MPLLETQNLAITIANKPICINLNLQIEPGQSWAILGSNGSGKTTLLHTLAGLRSPIDGSILLSNQAMTSLTRRMIAKQIGILLQHSDDSFPVTGLQMVLAGRHPYLGPWQWESAADIAVAKQFLTLMGLEMLEDRLLTSLSGGERRRLAIATLLCQAPYLYLLDEPTNHLDLKHQIDVLNYFKQLADSGQNSVVMVLHDVNLAARYCSHVILVDGKGHCIAGTAANLLQKSRLEAIYHHPLHELVGPFGTMWVAA